MNLICQALFRRTALVLLTAWLAGCGPTTGGTGTGEGAVTLADFGAKASSTCSAVFAAALSCPATSALPADPGMLAGTAPVVFTGMAASGPVTLTIKDNHAVLLAGCKPLHFEGDWGVLPTGEGRFFGLWTGPDAGAAVPAQLWVQAQAGQVDSVQVMVLDADGRVLSGPWPLRRASTPVDTPACP